MEGFSWHSDNKCVLPVDVVVVGGQPDEGSVVGVGEDECVTTGGQVGGGGVGGHVTTGGQVGGGGHVTTG